MPISRSRAGPLRGAERAREVRGEEAADRRRRRARRIERQPLPAVAERAVERRERAAGLDRHRHVGRPGGRGRASRRSRRRSTSSARGRRADVEVRAEAATPRARRASAGAARRTPAPPPTVAGPHHPGAARRRRPRRAAPPGATCAGADDLGPARVTSPPGGAARASRRTPWRRGRSCAGWRAPRGRRRRAAASSRAGRRARRGAASAAIFSTPMPCSPVMLPPSATHASRISRPAASTRATSSAVALVEEEDRVDVAVAGVEDVADAQAVALGGRRDARAGCRARACAARRRPACSSSAPAGRRRRRRACGTSRARRARRRRARRGPRARRAPADAAHALRLRRRARPPGRRARPAARRPASVGRPTWNAASTAPRISRSIISSAAGTMPAAMMPETASLAASTESKTASSVRYASGRADEAQRRARDDAERALGADDEPDQVVARAGPRPRRRASRPRPTGSTSSTPSTWFVVTPYLSVCGPPEFSATLPPIVHAGWLEGSGA